VAGYIEVQPQVRGLCGRFRSDQRGNGMSRHEQEDDRKKYEGNGHDPNRPVPQKDPGGKHGKPDTDDKDEDPKK
jgi:hypothetical protein